MKLFNIISIIFSGIIVLMLIYPIYFQGYGKGQQTAYVTAVESRGFLFKTKRVYVKSDLASSKEDIYCILDEKVFEQLQNASENQDRVKLFYEDQGITLPGQCFGETSTVVEVK